MTRIATLLALSCLLAAPARADDFSVPTDEIFHYSVMDALRNGVYKGGLTVKALERVGDFGLGTYNHLDGELVGLDGVFYRIDGGGKVSAAEADRQIPFGSFAFFKDDVRQTLKPTGDFGALQEQILRSLPSRNQLYAIRVKGTFAEVTAGGARKLAEGDRTPIAELMKGRPLFTRQNVTGTIIGFYFPTYVGGVDLSPFHMHFLSDDKTFGGHMVEVKLTGAELQVSLDSKKGIDIELPRDNNEFTTPWTTGGSAQKSY